MKAVSCVFRLKDVLFCTYTDSNLWIYNIQAPDVHLCYFNFILAVYKLIVALSMLTSSHCCRPDLHKPVVNTHSHMCPKAAENTHKHTSTHTLNELGIAPNRLSEEPFDIQLRFENKPVSFHTSVCCC